MPEVFDEDVFLWSLINRAEDTRENLTLFRPDWLKDPANRAILAQVFKFTKEFGIPPDCNTLDKLFQEEDEQIWQLRYKDSINKFRGMHPELPEQLYCLSKAKDLAVVRSFQQLAADQDFIKDQVNYDGSKILTEVNRWLNQFVDVSDEESANLEEAVERLVKEEGWMNKSFKFETGIEPIDDWTAGGLRSRQLGIFMAPTGHGKSVILMNLAYKMALQDEVNVWFITNELTMHEQTERFMSRVTGTPIHLIQEDPYYGYHNFGNTWKSNMNDRLRLTAINREVTTDALEQMMLRWKNIHGWMPQVICLDFMERMKPNESGYDRAAEWNWLGAISKDLVRFAKRHNIIIWTACQTNRSGLRADEYGLDLAMAQSSIRHLQESSAVIGMFKKRTEGEEGSGTETYVMDFKPLKLRHGKMSDKSISLRVDLRTMLITNEVVVHVERNEEDEEDDSKKKNLRPHMKGGK